MDLFGKAVYDYYKNNKNHPLLFTYGGVCSKKTRKDIGRYFRKSWQLNTLEKKLIKLINGKTLDIGCATGYYIPFMQKRTDVVGIDTSDYLIKICHEKGLTNCVRQNVFDYMPEYKFDTITLLEGDIGLGGSEENLMRLLVKLKELLNPGGQVLTIQNNFEAEYVDSEIQTEYGDEQETIKWSYMNMYFLKEKCEESGFNFELLACGKGTVYLARLTLHKPA